MKKFALLVLALALLVTACGGGAAATEAATEASTDAAATEAVEATEAGSETAPASDKVYKIGVDQLMEHAALNDARTGFEEELKALGVNFELDYKNAQGEVPTAALIAEGFVADGVDMIYAIATPAAQAAAQSTTDIPVLFSAVTDPVEAKIVTSMEQPGGNVTGTIDAADVTTLLGVYQMLDPEIKTIGVLYNTSEVNSEVQLKEVQEIAPTLGLAVEAVGINSVNELSAAMETLIPKIDALYLLSDNLVANSIATVSDLLIENNMISISAEESQVKGGALLTTGHTYYELGKQTAQMAKKILVDGIAPADIPVEKPQVLQLTVNKTTADKLGVDITTDFYKDAIIVE